MAAWILNLLQEEVTTLILRQTDGAAQDGNMTACFGGELSHLPKNTQLVISEVRGSVEQAFGVAYAPGNDKATFMMQSKPGLLGYASWNAGAWTIRLNVTSNHPAIYWREAHVCRVNSAGVSQESIGSNLTIDQQMGSSGVKTAHVSGAASPGALASDTVYIVCVFENLEPFTSNALGITPDQDIDTPLVVGDVSVLSARPVFNRPFFRRPRFNRPGAWRPSFSIT